MNAVTSGQYGDTGWELPDPSTKKPSYLAAPFQRLAIDACEHSERAFSTDSMPTSERMQEVAKAFFFDGALIASIPVMIPVGLTIVFLEAMMSVLQVVYSIIFEHNIDIVAVLKAITKYGPDVAKAMIKSMLYIGAAAIAIPLILTAVLPIAVVVGLPVMTIDYMIG